MPERDRLVAIDQTEFFNPADPRVSMGELGFVYVPAGCAGDGTCRRTAGCTSPFTAAANIRS